MEPIIAAEHLGKTYRSGKLEVQALRDVTFTVEPGEFVAIVGPSGSGKSTLFYVLGGLTSATSGSLSIQGHDFSRLNDAQRTSLRRSQIGFVFQRFNLLPTVSALTNIEIAHEIAQRIQLTELEVRNVISYYSLLHLKPHGKFHVQVCTNISCMLRGGNELLAHCSQRLGIGHKETTLDGVFSLEEVECIGACCWAPAVQVNYDFHDNLTPQLMDTVLETYAARAREEAK